MKVTNTRIYRSYVRESVENTLQMKVTNTQQTKDLAYNTLRIPYK